MSNLWFVFNSSGAFSKHRTGPQSNRRCLTEEEMQAKGMFLNYRDLYIAEQFTPEVKQRKLNADQRNSANLGLGG